MSAAAREGCRSDREAKSGRRKDLTRTPARAVSVFRAALLRAAVLGTTVFAVRRTNARIGSADDLRMKPSATLRGIPRVMIAPAIEVA